jgi:hypothetical protein
MQDLTEAQQKYFKGTQMKDANGSLLVCYHRTNHDFDAFDKSKIGTGRDIGFLGQGFYFTTDAKYSEEYGRNQYTCYLNIQKPFIINKADYQEIVDIMNYLRERHPDYGKPNGPIELALQPSEEQHELTPKEFNGGFFFAGMWQAYSIQLTEYVKSHGYDGIIIDTPSSGNVFEIVVFEPNQIKAIDNLYPTKSDNFKDNSKEYLKENNKNLSLAERYVLATYIKEHKNKKKIFRNRDKNKEIEKGR